MPSSGTYAQGDIVWRRNLSAGQNAGWVCVTVVLLNPTAAAVDLATATVRVQVSRG